NMGAWGFVDRRIERALGGLDIVAKRPRFAGRAEAASPATGLFKRHLQEQARLGEDALAAWAGAMTIEIKGQTLGESVTEATVARWLKQPGEAIARDEPVVELETDKVTLEVPAPAAGTLGEIRAGEGTNVPVGAVLGVIADGSTSTTGPHPAAAEAAATLSRRAGEGLDALERSGPAVRKLIAESGLDAAQIGPTGPT